MANRTDIKKFVWVEPTYVSIEVDANTEYQVVTHDKTFRIEFAKDETIIFFAIQFWLYSEQKADIKRG